MRRKTILSIIAIIFFIGIVTGGYLFISSNLRTTIADAPQPNPQTTDNENNEDTIPKEDKRKITISAVGDIMVHIPQYQAAYRKDTDTYDFSENFQAVSSIVQEADLAIANLETVFAGRDKKISGYPVFNTPDEMGQVIKETGFDVLSTANNHSLDKGEYGLLRTLDVLEELGLTAVGTHRSQEEKNKIVIKEIDGIKIAFVAYTYSTNGFPVPQGKDYIINLIDEAKIMNDLEKAKAYKPDLIVASMHWGNEYQRQASGFQKELAQKMIGNGVDIILGSHPHVIQPIEKIQVETETGEKREGVVIYSLGNFISNQNMQTLNMKYVDSGVILTFEIEKDFVANEIKITNINYVPTWVHKYNKNGLHYKVIPVEEAIKDYEVGNKRDLSDWDYRRLKDVLIETNEQFTAINQGQ